MYNIFRRISPAFFGPGPSPESEEGSPSGEETGRGGREQQPSTFYPIKI